MTGVSYTMSHILTEAQMEAIEDEELDTQTMEDVAEILAAFDDSQFDSLGG
jgi:hypothetical protein